MNDAAEVDIRPIRQEDAGAVAELVAQLGYQRTPEQVGHWVGDLDSRSGQACFVAELNGEVVAWIDVSLERHLQSEVFGLIGGLVVREGLRGAGIGRRLCEKDSGHLPEHPRGRAPFLPPRWLPADKDLDGV
jgi:GNAT superfamily N-acetyltransferase